MPNLLILGGPLHGQTLEVPIPENGMRISPPPSAFLLRKDNEPIPQPIQYVARTVAATTDNGQKLTRMVMAVEQIPPQQLMMALADALVKAWIQEGVQIDEGGIGSQSVPGSGGRGSDAAPGTGLIAP